MLIEVTSVLMLKDTLTKNLFLGVFLLVTIEPLDILLIKVTLVEGLHSYIDS
jgi:hypothetical protein